MIVSKFNVTRIGSYFLIRGNFRAQSENDMWIEGNLVTDFCNDHWFIEDFWSVRTEIAKCTIQRNMADPGQHPIWEKEPLIGIQFDRFGNSNKYTGQTWSDYQDM